MSERLTQEDEKELREALEKSTDVVAWYPHNHEVRGPFGRWFECTEVAKDHKDQVAESWDDCTFAAVAMNLAPVLLSEIDALRGELKQEMEASDHCVNKFREERDRYKSALKEISKECPLIEKLFEDESDPDVALEIFFESTLRRREIARKVLK